MRIKVISFNVLADEFINFPDPSDYYAGVDPADLKSAARLPKIFRKIKELSPDVAMLQEMTKKISKEFIAAFKEYQFFPIAWHQTEEAKQYPYGNQIMVRRSILTSARASTAYLHHFGGAVGLLDVRLIDGQDIMFINIHFDSEKHKNRLGESTAVAQLVEKYFTTHAIILGGDFNTDHAAIHKKFEPLISAVQKPTGTYLCESPMIDYLYVGGRGATVIDGFVDKRVCSKKKLCRQQTIVRYGSDHYPVVAYISVEQHDTSQSALCTETTIVSATNKKRHSRKK